MLSVPVIEPYGPPDIETKYVFHRSNVKKIISWLNGRLMADKEHPAGIISSIYYDSRGWDSLAEKINSDYLKSKARLRWYHGFDTGMPLEESFFEIKFKAGLRRKKIRGLSGLSGKFLGTISLDDPKLLELPNRFKGQGCMTFRGHLFPTFLVRYRRLRFIEPVTHTRINVDYDIHVPKIHPGLNLHSNPMKLAQAVLEIKGTVYNLPDWLLHLKNMGCRKQSFSKYLSGYLHLTGNRQ